MGVHYAHPGTVAMRTHNITRQNVYGGPAIKIGSEVSDIAAGGQILLTEVRPCLELLLLLQKGLAR